MAHPGSWRARVMAGLLAVSAVSAIGSWRSAAYALDSFRGTRTNDLSERRHTGILTLHRSHAELVVKRTVWNGGSTSDQALFEIYLPPGAVATRLRTRGIGGPEAPWFDGELLEAEEAARRYQELTGVGGHYPKDPALLSWRDQQLLWLQVFPCPPRSEKVVEYTLKLPTEYREGAYHLALPPLGTEQLAARIQLLAGAPGDHLLVNGRSVASGTLLAGRGRGELDLALQTAEPPLRAEVVSLPFAGGRVLTRYALRAAPQLSSLPKQAYVALVIDASRSTSDGFEQAAKVALDAYLSHFKDAHVELVTFDRRVRRELGGFVPVAAARAALPALVLGRGNGSDVDLALFEADQLLSATPNGAARRIVLLTDGLTRSSLTPERLRGALARSDAIVHLALLDEHGTSLLRNDEHVWANAIRATGGLVWQASAPTDMSLGVEERRLVERTFEEWARPLRIDRLDVFSDNFHLAEQVVLGPLDEGAGREQLYIDSVATRNLSVTGELWARPVRSVAVPEPAAGSLWAALVFGSELLAELSEPEMMSLALAGRAVSPVTSYLAIEPGVRPSTEGLTEQQRGGRSTRAPMVRMGGSCSAGRGPQLDLQEFLNATLRADFLRCGGQPDTAYADLETTVAEIVQVEVRASAAPLDPLLVSCVTEAAWSLQLPTAFQAEWATFRVEL